jgi:hypothetical protein
MMQVFSFLMFLHGVKEKYCGISVLQKCGLKLFLQIHIFKVFPVGLHEGSSVLLPPSPPPKRKTFDELWSKEYFI